MPGQWPERVFEDLDSSGGCVTREGLLVADHEEAL